MGRRQGGPENVFCEGWHSYIIPSMTLVQTSKVHKIYDGGCKKQKFGKHLSLVLITVVIRFCMETGE